MWIFHGLHLLILSRDGELFPSVCVCVCVIFNYLFYCEIIFSGGWFFPIFSIRSSALDSGRTSLASFLVVSRVLDQLYVMSYPRILIPWENINCALPWTCALGFGFSIFSQPHTPGIWQISLLLLWVGGWDISSSLFIDGLAKCRSLSSSSPPHMGYVLFLFLPGH